MKLSSEIFNYEMSVFQGVPEIPEPIFGLESHGIHDDRHTGGASMSPNEYPYSESHIRIEGYYEVDLKSFKSTFHYFEN